MSGNLPFARVSRRTDRGAPSDHAFPASETGARLRDVTEEIRGRGRTSPGLQRTILFDGAHGSVSAQSAAQATRSLSTDLLWVAVSPALCRFIGDDQTKPPK